MCVFLDNQRWITSLINFTRISDVEYLLFTYVFYFRNEINGARPGNFKVRRACPDKAKKPVGPGFICVLKNSVF